ncbi:MAG: choline/ethanolamine kinase family protein [Campylobacterota bacterium]|nr:choline/ethanolamine kinase family protein [Campylobacterota bacterium]
MQDSIAWYHLFEKETIQRVTLLEAQGFCNENYLVITDKKKYIARKLIRTDIDRKFEYEVQGLAFKEGITAKPLMYDKKNALMLSEFVEGEHKALLKRDDLKALAHTLQKLHTITRERKPIAIEIENETEETVKAFEIIEAYEKEYVLCHNDLNPQNILWSKEIKLIDWEYAGINDRYFDLASVCVEFKLDKAMQALFLEVYFSANPYSLQKLEAYKTLYNVLCKEWFDENHLIGDA